MIIVIFKTSELTPTESQRVLEVLLTYFLLQRTPAFDDRSLFEIVEDHLALTLKEI